MGGATGTRESLLIDLYELTMAEAYWRAGLAERSSTFSCFVRGLPEARGYLVAAGLDDVLGWLESLSFSDDDLAVLSEVGGLGDDFLAWLGGLAFTGDVRAVTEGTVVFGGEPILEVDAPLVEAQLAETLVLNQITTQTVLASKAARMVSAADGRPVVDFALRRTPGIDAGMKLARVGRITGLAATSNVAGAARYGLPASGTMAHAFVQALGDETEAFRVFARAFGDAAVLLVDTYDTPRGVARAIQVIGERRAEGGDVRAIRIDSGDLATLACDARVQLDAAGLDDVGVILSGGLDEHRIAALVSEAGDAVSGFGVGSALGAPPDVPSLDSVYKLVAAGGQPVLKTSTGKAILPGAKQVWRRDDGGGDLITLATEGPPGRDREPLLAQVMRAGGRTEGGVGDLDVAADHHRRQLAAVPAPIRRLEAPEVHPVGISEELARVRQRLVTELGDGTPGG